MAVCLVARAHLVQSHSLDGSCADVDDDIGLGFIDASAPAAGHRDFAGDRIRLGAPGAIEAFQSLFFPNSDCIEPCLRVD